ncbi:Bug family tripartite tricarboxylate transporter substrate binding protein [Hydrogenophaga sp.]|jgi:tripartite-type tricarboxylate transporter receptor subunit TctC|uniref:Bug family tripartite tricarboxylate transporter substrate binding protein n=1 Tax=Hydrogenophaga sp. TaxID=1904254 RepID=UPI003F7109AF
MRFVAILFLLFGFNLGWAQTYPSKPVVLVNGFAAGGSLDAVVRLVAIHLGKELGQSVVVENRAGATGTIAAASVARAPADGYTLLFGVAGNLVVAPATMKNVGYDPVTSFDAVSEVARGPYVLVANGDLPVRNVAELFDYARKNPGKLNYGSSGPGSVQHFAGELLNRAGGVSLTHIPYRGGGQSYPALMAGDVHALFDTMPGPQMFAQSGKVRPIAVTGPKRLKSYPDVPTFTEQGFPGVDVGFMYGVVAPAGTPPAVIAKLNAAMHRALANPEMKALLDKQDLEPSPGTPEAFKALMVSEGQRWKRIVAESGFKPE